MARRRVAEFFKEPSGSLQVDVVTVDAQGTATVVLSAPGGTQYHVTLAAQPGLEISSAIRIYNGDDHHVRRYHGMNQPARDRPQGPLTTR